MQPYTILVYGDDCLYPQNPAIGLGICAAIFLIVAQVTFSAVSGCCGCCRSRSIPSETKRIVSIVCAVFSWIAAVIAFALFIEGAAWNANVVRVAEAPYCPYLKDGVFAGAGVLALAATALGITSFIMQRQTQPAPGGATAAAAPPTSAAGTPAGWQPPSPEVVKGHPLLPSGKPQNDYPVKPQGYEQQPQPQPQVVPPPTESHSHPQGYGAQAPQIQNHQLPPRPAPEAAAAAPAVVVASLASAPLEPSQLPAAAALGVAMAQPLPQVPAVPLPQVPIPASTVPSAAGPGSGPSALSTVIRNEVARQGVKLAAQVVTQSLFSDNNNVGDGVLSMMAGSAGGDYAVQTAN
ncbi:hypothetical protein BDA96_09G157300 [Sorghum bicolor]|uniref:Uncharacterized protein n=2 Tax=Sorghum bicolor TaxID=4558 RepID=A0A1B6P8M0_SORBI|nr:arginine-glutamic acid dipeptide repeats protein-like isoform X2 [Sorghum bicolor]KAG0518225.1 hypothetical protein BDA96_09G157300 [Sorghum bicolor]KXG22078.1 hypothetical protein SORBI_3009G150000 [Sorghum bicolor]|eukprot:XP_021302674.1 arginine-glutamic acid dipeptide repeats protein-like isoform X2 [Sorghum bicolor]